MFNSRSRWVRGGGFASVSRSTEQAFQHFFFLNLVGNSEDYCRTPGNESAQNCEPDWGVNLRRDSENIDTMRRTTAYIAAATLSLDPQYAGRALSDGRTVADHHARWEQFHYDWLKWFATHGPFASRLSL